MKKEVVFGVLLIFSISLISAACHPICNPEPTCDDDLEGVFIENVCYNCGQNDNICPQDFGAVCTGDYRDDDCEYTPERFFSYDEVVSVPDTIIVDILDDNYISLVITETWLTEGMEVDLTIKKARWGIIPDSTIATGLKATVDATSPETKATFNWSMNDDLIAYLGGDEQEEEVSDVYFVASQAGGNPEAPGTSSFVTINITLGAVSTIDTCADYDTEEWCELNPERVSGTGNLGTRTSPGDGGTCVYHQTGKCVWTLGGCTTSVFETANESNDDYNCEAARDFACNYPNQVKDGDCAAGDEFFRVTYSASEKTDQCLPWTTAPIACPQSLKLPFFGIFNFLITLSLVGVIYFVFRRK